MSGLHDPAGLHLADLRRAHIGSNTVLRSESREQEGGGKAYACEGEKFHAHAILPSLAALEREPRILLNKSTRRGGEALGLNSCQSSSEQSNAMIRALG